MAVGEVFAGLSAFKAMLDTAKALKDMNDAAVRGAASIELTEKILAAQASQMTLSEEVRELKEEIVRFETWQTEKEKYELQSLGGHAFVRMLKPEARDSEPPHWICTNCFSNKKISPLQFRGIVKDRVGHHWECPACKTLILPNVMEPEWIDK